MDIYAWRWLLWIAAVAVSFLLLELDGLRRAGWQGSLSGQVWRWLAVWREDVPTPVRLRRIAFIVAWFGGLTVLTVHFLTGGSFI